MLVKVGLEPYGEDRDLRAGDNVGNLVELESMVVSPSVSTTSMY